MNFTKPFVYSQPLETFPITKSFPILHVRTSKFAGSKFLKEKYIEPRYFTPCEYLKLIMDYVRTYNNIRPACTRSYERKDTIAYGLICL